MQAPGDAAHRRAAESAQADFVNFQPRFQPPGEEPAESGRLRRHRPLPSYSSATGSRSMAMRSSACLLPPTLYFSKK